MTDYDFHQLNDKEFEILVANLLSCIEDVNIERFKPGRDQGVDGRFFSPDGGEVIIQAKHWVKSEVSRLISYVKSTEAPKVQKLNPKRYIFVTSLDLSRKNKKVIRDAFGECVISDSDIIGREDLNDYLDKCPAVEERTYKLWISSTTILSRFINAGIKGRSDFQLESIERECSKFVQTEDFFSAIQLLDERKCLILCGDPGIGKTTLANQICLRYVAREFEFVFVQDSIDEAEDVFDEDKKQIFYFDDFLGRNYLNALRRNEDTAIVNFMRRVSSSRDKRFVLTSRTTILNRGKSLTDQFEINNIERNEYVINISSLSLLDRARILYNHIWFGTLGEEYIDEIYMEKRYIAIASHKNFNPRLISFITDTDKISDIPSYKYWNYIEETLRNPAAVWSHVYDNQMDGCGRLIGSLVVFNGGAIAEEDLRNAFNKARLDAKFKYFDCEYGDFNVCARVVVGAILDRQHNSTSHAATYELFNPSVGDFVLNRFRSDDSFVYYMYSSLRTRASVKALQSLLKNQLIDVDKSTEFVMVLISDVIKSEEDKVVNYALALVAMASMEKMKPFDYVDGLSEWALSNCIYYAESGDTDEMSLILLEGISAGHIGKNENVLSKYVGLCLENYFDHTGWLGLSNVINSLDCAKSEELKQVCHKKIIEHWEDNIETNVVEESFLDHFYPGQESQAQEELFDRVLSLLQEYDLGFTEEDAGGLCEFVDVDGIIYSNAENALYDDTYERTDQSGSQPVDELAEVQDLFSRT